MNYKFNTKIRLFLIFIALSILFFGCEQKNNSTGPENHERGEIDQTINNGNLNVEYIQLLLDIANVTHPFTLQYPITAYSVR